MLYRILQHFFLLKNIATLTTFFFCWSVDCTKLVNKMAGNIGLQKCVLGLTGLWISEYHSSLGIFFGHLSRFSGHPPF